VDSGSRIKRQKRNRQAAKVFGDIAEETGDIRIIHPPEIPNNNLLNGEPLGEPDNEITTSKNP
jgi:hypothetical protein